MTSLTAKETVSASLTSDSNDLVNHWSKFYKAASTLSASPPSDAQDSQQSIARIQITLNSMTQILFGLDSNKKSQVVTHGSGALELIVALVNTSQVLETEKEGTQASEETCKSIIMSSLKAIKTCVVRNPVGRIRCRSAQVLPLLKKIVIQYLHPGEVTMVEDAMTTLAATCLGDDLNALQGAMEFSPYLPQATELFPNATSLHGKITYLTTLFDTLREEQAPIIASWGSDTNASHQFFAMVQQAEATVQTGGGQNPEESFTTALTNLEPYMSHTKLLNSLMSEIRYQRARECLKTNNAELCCQDTNRLLEESTEKDDKVSRTNVLKLNIRALIQLEQWEEAKQRLGRLKVLDPIEKDISELQGLIQS